MPVRYSRSDYCPKHILAPLVWAGRRRYLYHCFRPPDVGVVGVVVVGVVGVVEPGLTIVMLRLAVFV